MKTFVVAIAVAAAAAGAVSAQRPQTFTGVITDDMCPAGDHSAMQMGPSAAECARACVGAHGAAYVLYGGKSLYKLSSKQPLESLAGQAVTIVGVLDAKTNTITVNSIARVHRPERSVTRSFFSSRHADERRIAGRSPNRLTPT